MLTNDERQRLIQRIIDNPTVQLESDKWAFNTLSNMGVDVPLDGDALSEFEPFWLMKAVYTQQLLLSIATNELGVRATGRPEDLYNPPSADTLDKLDPETDEFFEEVISSLDEFQAKHVLYTILRDPSNKIDFDNLSHYFC